MAYWVEIFDSNGARCHFIGTAVTSAVHKFSGRGLSSPDCRRFGREGHVREQLRPTGQRAATQGDIVPRGVRGCLRRRAESRDTGASPEKDRRRHSRDIRFDENGDLVEGPVTILRIGGKGAVVDRVVTVRAP